MGTGDGGSTILFIDVNMWGRYLAVIVRTSQYPVQMSLHSAIMCAELLFFMLQ